MAIDKIETPSILISMPQLQDPTFWHAVVLLIDQQEDGAMGFLINRPSDMPLAAMMKDKTLEIPANIPSWIGGPVEQDNGLILSYPKAKCSPDNTVVSSDIILCSSSDALNELSSYGAQFIGMTESQIETIKADTPEIPLYPYRFVVGYAGWGADQLDEEVFSGSWLQLPFDKELVFNTPWQHMWDLALAKLKVNPNELTTSQQSLYC